MEDERYGIWFDGDGGKVPPHWLVDEDGETSWSGSKEEADHMQGVFGGKIIPIPRTFHSQPETRCRAREHVWKSKADARGYHYEYCERCKRTALQIIIEQEDQASPKTGVR